MLGILGLDFGAGCVRPPAFGSLVASEGSERVLRAFAKATLGRRSEALLGLFSKDCLQGCRGFRLVAEQPLGELHPFRWKPRLEPGSLADDLAGQLALYERVDRAKLSFLTLAFDGPRQAEALVALAVDGRLRQGGRRSDRGTLRLALRRQADDSWQIEGIALADLRSVMSRAPTFGAPELLSPGQRAALSLARDADDPTGPADLARIGADRGAGLAVADLDGDGFLDVFLPGPGLGRLLRNDGKGRLVPAPAIQGAPASDLGASALFGDLDGDGDPDVFVLTSVGDSRWLENRDGRLVLATWSGPVSLGPGATAALLSSRGDGRLDLVFVPSPGSGSSSPAPGSRPIAPQLYEKTGAVFRPVPGALPPGLDHTAALCAADLDDDGKTDLVHVSRLGPVTLLRNLGGRFEPMARPALGPILGRACTVADLDGDGRPDLAIAAVRSPEAWKATLPAFPMPSPFLGSTGAASLRARLWAAAQGSFWLRNDGSGRFARLPLASPASLGWDLAIAAEDLDGDGRAEVALGGGFHWLPSPKTRPRARPQDDTFFVSVLPRLISGRPAPALRPHRGSLGASRGVTLLLGSGASRVDVGVPAGLDLPPGVRALAWADLDRDGRPELLVRRSDGALLCLRMKAPLGSGRTLTLRIGSGGPRSTPHGALVTAQGLDRRATAVLDGGATDRPYAEARLGLGTAARADRVEVRWPGGIPEEWQDLDTNAAYTLHAGQKNPVRGLAASSGSRPHGPGATAPGRKADDPGHDPLTLPTPDDPRPRPAPDDPPTRPAPEDPRPAPGSPPRFVLQVAGLPLGRLSELLVAPAVQAAALGPRPLRAFLGRTGTVLYVPPASCPTCPAYLVSLAKAAPGWHKRGIATLVLGSPPGALPRAAPPGFLALVLTGPRSTKPASLGLLLVLDPAGKPSSIYLGSQPDPALLEHRLPSTE